MEYRVEHGPKYEMIAYTIRCQTKDSEQLKRIPQFWDEVWGDGRGQVFYKLAKADSLGICGICSDFDWAMGEFDYSIATDAPEHDADIPEGATKITIPASKWLKFISVGPMSKTLQPMIQRIFNEFLPKSEFKHAGTPEVEYYSDGDMDAPDYVCEYWVPVE